MERVSRVCPECGVAFTPKNATQKFCTEQCRLAKKKRYNKEYNAERRIERKAYREERKAGESYKKNWRKADSLAELARLARAAGMSYGQYISVMKMQRMRGAAE